MIKYRNYKGVDFVTDPLFRAWILDRDQKAALLWLNWLTENADKTNEIEEARALLFALREKNTEPCDEEISARVEDTLRTIRMPADEIHILGITKPWYYTYSRIAAVICLAIGLGWTAHRFLIKSTENQQFQSSVYYPESNGIAQINNTNEPMTIVLEDSSTVILKPHSELHYPKTFAAGRREVHLKGEAFFQISRNLKRPFLVLTDELITEVLGTSFTVKSFEKDKKASVSVKTGRVSVYTKQEEKAAKRLSSREIVGVILKPNQEVVFDKEEIRLVKVIVPSPERIKTVAADALIFDESPVKNVFKMLESEYGIEITANEETISACLLTANLTGLSMYDQLDMVCRIIHARYEIIDAQIIIHSKGCKSSS